MGRAGFLEMKPHPECGVCLVHWVFERTVPYIPERETARLIRDIVGELLRRLSPTANLGALCNHAVHKASEFVPGLVSHYGGLKERSNENAKGILPKALTYIKEGKTPQNRLARACFLSAAANVAPLNAPSSPYTFQGIQDIINHNEGETIIIGDLFRALKNSRQVLYITDNAGEIGFDSLVIREIKDIGPKVTLVVKNQTFFEDATMDDVHAFGLEQLVDEIVTVPGFLTPHEMDPSVARSFESSDLVIAKGTGSYEALHGEIVDKKAAYMLKVKCKPIARELGMEEGNIIVKVE